MVDQKTPSVPVIMILLNNIITISSGLVLSLFRLIMGDQKTPSAPVMMILLNDIISISPGLVPLERKGGQMKKHLKHSA